MKMKRLIYPILILILVTLACGPTPATAVPTIVPAKPTPTSGIQLPTATTVKVVLKPTETEAPPEPTATKEVILPTDTPSAPITNYYTEEFDNGTADWMQFVVAGDTTKTFYENTPGRLKFVVPSNETYAYAENIKYSYSDVLIQANFETTESSSRNGISLFCRKSDKGWYELRVSTMGDRAGFIEVYRYDPRLKASGKNPYIDLLSPTYKQDALPVAEILAGYKTNTIGLQCSNKNLTFYANGKPLMHLGLKKAIFVTDDYLTEGTTGIGVESGSASVPVVIEFEWVSTSAPK
jgi:hypothetical protein